MSRSGNVPTATSPVPTARSAGWWRSPATTRSTGCGPASRAAKRSTWRARGGRCRAGPGAGRVPAGERARIDDCLDQLEADKADCVRGAYLDGLTYEDLATRHNVPLNTMRTWLRRSLLKLRECLRHERRRHPAAAARRPGAGRRICARPARGPETRAARRAGSRAEPALRAELTLWRKRLAGLDGDFAETAPPATRLTAIEARLFGALRAAARLVGFAGAVARPDRRGRGVAVLAIGVTLCAAAPDAQALRHPAGRGAPGAGGSEVELHRALRPAAGQVRITSLSGEPIPDKDYELWSIMGDKPPVSMGVIPVERGEFTLNAAAGQHRPRAPCSR